MSRFSVLAFACDADRDILGRGIVQDRRRNELSEFDCETLFHTRALVDEDISIASFHSIWARGRAEELRWLDQAFAQAPNLLIIFCGPRSRNSVEFAQGLRKILSWRDRHPDAAVILVKVTKLDLHGFDWPQDSLIVDASWIEVQEHGPHQRNLSVTEDEFGAALIEARKRIQKSPEIGIGVLLISAAGRFLLAERLRTPCRGSYGTFGGSLTHLSTPEDALALQAKRQFGIKSGFVAGPLLACTNMIVKSVQAGLETHYVDLTFLAFSQTEDVLVGDTLRHRPINVEGTARYWFEIGEMRDFYQRNLLFAPVANAFNRYCSWAALGQVAAVTGKSNSFAMHHSLTEWVQKLHADAMDVLLAIASDKSRNEKWPSFFDNVVTIRTTR